MKEPIMKKTGLFDGGGSEPDDWITVDNGSHIPLENGQSKASAIKEHFGGKSKKDYVMLPPKEYGELCSAIKTKFANRIPKCSGMLYKDSYYRYNCTNDRVICIGKIPIEGNEDTIKIEERYNNGRIK